MRTRNFVASLSSIFALVSCVPHVLVDGTPCPCGPGYVCCLTLLACLPADQACPDVYPDSSLNACMRDNDCPTGEQCASWRLESGSMGGPMVCRRSCDGSHPCADGETCRLSLHDGAATSDLQIARMCLDTTPPKACTGWTCDGCPNLELGQTLPCEQGEIRGCAFAIHPQCGLKCQETFVATCAGAVEPCLAQSCASVCPGGVEGGVSCSRDDLSTCLGARPPPGESCDRLCTGVVLQACQHGCGMGPNGEPTCYEQ